jgi:hypothetical protein
MFNFAPSPDRTDVPGSFEAALCDADVAEAVRAGHDAAASIVRAVPTLWGADDAKEPQASLDSMLAGSLAHVARVRMAELAGDAGHHSGSTSTHAKR